MDLEITFALAFVIIGIFMMLAEAVVPGSFILVPATVLLILGLFGLIYPAWLFTWISPIIALAVLIPMTFAAFKLYQMLAPPAPPETTVATSLIGKIGIVDRHVVPGNIRGKVRIDNDIWSATSSNPIPKGIRVKVVDSSGVHVNVEPLTTAESN